MAAASQLWYVPFRPDLLLIAPCDTEGPLPGPGAMFVSIDHLHASATSSPSAAASTASASSPAASASSAKWRHPRANAFLTAFGDIAKQQPRVVRCTCGASPCVLSALREAGGHGGVPDAAIPADWATNWQLPPPGPEHEAAESRRASAVQLWLDCTARAERELPREAGQEQPPEPAILAAAEVMLTDYLKGRVCFACSVPSTRMQRCSRCLQARYCSKDCQRAHWSEHKKECAAAVAAAAAGDATAEAVAELKPAEKEATAAAVELAAAAPAGGSG